MQAYPLTVDVDAAPEAVRDRHRQRHLARVHPRDPAARRLSHADAAPVVPRSRILVVARREQRRVTRDHLVVQDEAAGGEHDAAARAEDSLLAAAPREHADDAAVVLLHERLDEDVGLDAERTALDRAESTASIRPRPAAPAPCGRRDAGAATAE